MTDMTQSGASQWDAPTAAEREDRLYDLALKVAHFATGARMNEIEAGRALMEARAEFESDNDFGAWRAETLPDLHRNQALRFMQVAQEYGDKPVMLKALSMRALRALSAPSTPQSVREEAEARAEAGERVSAAEIERLKREAAEAAKRADAATAEADRQRNKADSLAEGQRDLVQKARAEAKAEAEKEAAAELDRARAEAKRAADDLMSERRRLAQAVEAAEAAAMAKAQAEAGRLAQEELDKLADKARDAKRIKEEAERQVNRLNERADYLSKRVDELKDFIRSTESEQDEAQRIDAAMKKVVDAVGDAMKLLQCLQHDHGAEVSRRVRQAADVFTQSAEALESRIIGQTLIHDAEYVAA